MFSEDFMPFIQAAQTLELGSDIRNSVLAIAVAHAIAATVDMPSSPVQSPEQHFNANTSTGLNTKLSCFNEAVIIDVAYAKDCVRKFWLMRYYSLHDCGVMYPPNAHNTFFEVFTPASRFFSVDELKLMNEHLPAIYRLRIAAGEVLKLGC